MTQLNSARVRLAVVLAALTLPMAAGAGLLFSDEDGEVGVVDDRGPEAGKELETINARAQGKLPD